MRRWAPIGSPDAIRRDPKDCVISGDASRQAPIVGAADAERQFEPRGLLDLVPPLPQRVNDSIVEHGPLRGTVVTDWSQKFRHRSASGGISHHYIPMLTSENVIWQHAPSPTDTGPR